MKLPFALTAILATAISVSACSTENNASAATDDVTTLRFSHLWPASAVMHTDAFVPWAKKIEEESGGRLKIEIYPSATLSKPDATYDAVAKGTVDLGVQVQGYINGRFPLTQIAELPGLSNSASQMSCMLQTLYDEGVITKEYDDTHLLFMIGSEPATLHTIDKPIRTPADLKGLRIRRPSAIGGEIIEAAGGAPVGLPATDLYTSLQRGVVDGMAFPWSPTGSFKLTDIVNTHTNMPFYSSALVVTMNKDKYDKLPADLKKVLDDNTGKAMSEVAAQVFDTEAEKYSSEARARGDVMIDIPDPLSDPQWKVPLEAGTKKYLADVSAMGLDAQSVYEKAKQASAACQS